MLVGTIATGKFLSKVQVGKITRRRKDGMTEEWVSRTVALRQHGEGLPGHHA